MGGDRAGGLVAVAVRTHTRAGVHAQVGMHVDDARRHPLSGAVHAGRIGRCRQSGSDLDHAAALHQHIGTVQAIAGSGQHGRALDEHRGRGDRAIGARVRIGLQQDLPVGGIGGCGEPGSESEGQRGGDRAGAEWMH